ncbi:UDP-3-O-(3-hydroxymyristoyl)glucosamine N-acyltransferase [Fodinicurvata sp. EGI_FJ10296]|uniref:UDP-3-O-(3-hydroxymyristoyl)glucosamine N-acyltransferase n=1 Tax=Fodinicurvata sp. EGI_FJ10296 TaxID=3231908 RepID=UPI0034545462
MADSRFFSNCGPFSLGQLADLIDGRIMGAGDRETEIVDAGPIRTVGSGAITFADSEKYLPDLGQSGARACIVAPRLEGRLPPAMAGLVVAEPYKAYAAVATAFYPDKVTATRVHGRAVIDEFAIIGDPVDIGAGAVIGREAEIGSGCRIGANATIGDGVRIGAGTTIGAGASLSHCIIGRDCRIYPGARIGQDGFGFAIDPEGHKKIPQLGRVVVGNRVEIGANTTVDRGAGEDTIIADGCFIDNQVQIGHNVRVGEGCVIIAQAGIAGSSVVETGSVIAAQAGIAGHLTIGTGSRIGALSGVMRDVPPGSDMLGTPAIPIREFWRQHVVLRAMAKKKKDE